MYNITPKKILLFITVVIFISVMITIFTALFVNQAGSLAIQKIKQNNSTLFIDKNQDDYNLKIQYIKRTPLGNLKHIIIEEQKNNTTYIVFFEDNVPSRLSVKTKTEDILDPISQINTKTYWLNTEKEKTYFTQKNWMLNEWPVDMVIETNSMPMGEYVLGRGVFITPPKGIETTTTSGTLIFSGKKLTSLALLPMTEPIKNIKDTESIVNEWLGLKDRINTENGYYKETKIQKRFLYDSFPGVFTTVVYKNESYYQTHSMIIFFLHDRNSILIATEYENHKNINRNNIQNTIRGQEETSSVVITSTINVLNNSSELVANIKPIEIIKKLGVVVF